VRRRIPFSAASALLLGSVALAVACGPKGPPAGERPLLLWRVEKDGAVNHLLGTCHLPIPLEHALPPEHHPLALDAARLVVGEIDLQEDGLEGAMALAFGTSSLREQLGAEPFRTLSIRVRDTVPATALDRMSPWMASTLVMGAGSSDPAAGGTPLDLAVMGAARGRGVDYLGLESLQEQAAMLRGHDALIVEELKAHDDPVRAAWAETRELLRACAATDPVMVAKVVKQIPEGLDAELLAARNHRWLERLGPELALGGTLVAVGAAHMFGEEGLVHQLQDDGYTVRLLTASASSAVWSPALPEAPAPVPPAPDAARVDAWVKATLPAVLGGSCGERGILTLCGLATLEDCPGRVERDIRLCVEQHSDRMPDAVPDRLLDPAQAGAVLPCLMAGPTAALVATPVDEVPETCPLKSMMGAPGLRRP
jgi:hypothetical protein